MAEDTRSTSQRASVASDRAGTVRGFDVRSWQGLTEVLKVARTSGLSDSAYAQFRDLVLQYAKNGGDVELRKKIEQALASFKTPEEKKTEPTSVTPVSKKNSSTEKSTTPPNTQPQTPTPPHPTIGGRRPVPSFLPISINEPEAATQEVPRITPENIASQTEAVSAPEEHTPPEEAPVDVRVTAHDDASVENTNTKIETQIEPEIPEQNQTTTTPPQTPTSVMEQTPKASASTRESDHDAVPAPIAPKPTSETKPILSMDEYRARIAHIKRDVNARIGNPVALIDARNEIGRTYMSALLNAMKATGPGSTVRIEDAMTALETAYEAVIAAPSNPVVPQTQIQEPPAITQQEAPPPLKEPAISVLEPTPHSPTSSGALDLDSTETLPEQSISSQRPAQPSFSEKMKTSSRISLGNLFARKQQTTAPQEQHTKKSQPISLTPEQPRTRIPSLIDLENDSEDFSDASDQTQIQNQTPKLEPAPVASVREVQHETIHKTVSEITNAPQPHLETKRTRSQTSLPLTQSTQPNELPHALVTSHASTSVGQAELATPEITEALYQLLHEWSIFKSSGVFGMGPAGSEHPLYVALARLSMGEVVSGRWENAKPEIIHTIKEYVDAWRHEQGVAYNPSETFEHYLRRVVQRILKRQQGEFADENSILDT